MQDTCQLCGRKLTTKNLRFVVTIENGKEVGGYTVGSDCLKKIKLGPNEKVEKYK